MFARKFVHTLCGVVLLGVLATTSTGAMWNVRRTTTFTFRSAVALPGVTLAPGSYMFEVLNPDSSADLVRVMNRDRNEDVHDAVHALHPSFADREPEIDHHPR